MSKNYAERTHKKTVESRKSMSPEQVRAGKCQTCRARRERIMSVRREEAKERQEYWNTLSKQQQIEVLDRRLGVGVGAKKQRSRINKV